MGGMSGESVPGGSGPAVCLAGFDNSMRMGCLQRLYAMWRGIDVGSG